MGSKKGKARSAVFVLRRVIGRLKVRVESRIKERLVKKMKQVNSRIDEKKLEEVVRQELTSQKLEKAAREIVKGKKEEEIINSLSRDIEQKIAKELSGKISFSEKEKQEIQTENISETIKNRIRSVVTSTVQRELQDAGMKVDDATVALFVNEKLEEIFEEERGEILNAAREIQEDPSKFEEALGRIAKKITSRIGEIVEPIKKGAGRVGAAITPAVGVQSRYVVPFGFVAPLFKDMSGPQVIKKVQELYHVPFDVGDKVKKNIKETYALIPENPRRGEKVFAWAYIHWDPRTYELVYEVVEPKLTAEEEKMLKKIEEKLEEKLDVIYVGKGEIEHHKEYLRNKIREIIELYGWKLDPETASKLEYFIFRDFIGLGKIEPLMHDPNIEDISCDGVGIPVYVFHRNPEYGQIKTNIFFKSHDELDSFVIKLAQKSGKMITVASPLLDATLPDGSRLQATLGGDIARRGSNFTIRKFTKEPLTPVHLMKYGTASSTLLAYLWICVEYGKSILVAGATATGKTTYLNAISLFIRPELKIVSIEDTAELTLPHPNWVPHVSRPGYGEKSYGSVEMFDLLKAALRQRPDYVIVGEVRGKEASVMFQGMATGHPALATIHANGIQAVVDRLTTPPISLSPALLENLDVLVFLEKTKIKGKFVRRTREVDEIEAVIVKENKVAPNIIFTWDPVKDEIKMVGRSKILEMIARFKGIDYETVSKELERRALFLEWMKLKGIYTYQEFTKWVRAYYTDPEKIMKMVMKDVRTKMEKTP